MKNSILVATAAAALSLGLGPAVAQETQNQEAEKLPRANEGEWIAMAGTARDIDSDGFTLDHGDGRIEIEMDGNNWRGDGHLQEGEAVRVTGQVEDDFYDERVLDAYSVYVNSSNTYYYSNVAARDADPADSRSTTADIAIDPDIYVYSGVMNLEDDEDVALTGTVVSTDDEELRLDTAGSTLKVDLSDLDGQPRLNAGDRVLVSGEFDDADLFENREIEAESVVRLRQS